MTHPHVEGRNLCKSYRNGVVALDHVSAIVPVGSFSVLAGPSGSGKTTLLSLLSTIDRPTTGTVYFAGEDITRHSEASRSRLRRRMGIVTQDYALISGMSVWENVTYPLIPRGVPRSERMRIAATTLDRLGLKSRLKARARELSGGEQQLVAMARAVAGVPEILFVDEPTSNLDDTTAQLVIRTLVEANQRSTTIVAATHDPRIMNEANQIVEMIKGRRTSAATERAAEWGGMLTPSPSTI